MRRGCTGTPQSYEFVAPRIRKGLLLACGALDPTPKAKAKGPRGRPPVRPDDPVTDVVLAHMRWMHEECGASAIEIAKSLGVNLERIRRLLDYQTRAHILPAQQGA